LGSSLLRPHARPKNPSSFVQIIRRFCMPGRRKPSIEVIVNVICPIWMVGCKEIAANKRLGKGWFHSRNQKQVRYNRSLPLSFSLSSALSLWFRVGVVVFAMWSLLRYSLFLCDRLPSHCNQIVQLARWRGWSL
jgi:hypothetical protein